MRYDNTAAFKKHLASAGKSHLSPLYLIASSNSREVTEAFSLIKEKLVDAEFLHFTSESLSISALSDELQTISAFSPKRLVHIKNGDKLNKGAQEVLLSYFSSPNPQVHLVISASSLDKRTAFYKSCEKYGVILHLPEEKPWMREKTVQRWLREKVYSDGKQIEPRAAEVLMGQIGSDQELLVQELEKLYCYIGDRPVITYGDVCAISSHVNVDDIWKLGEAIFHFDAKGAVEVLNELLDEELPLLTLLRQIRSQFQSFYQIATLIDSGRGREEVGKQFPYLTPHLLNKKLATAAGYGTARFKKGLLAIDETELLLKSSARDPHLLAEMLIVRLSVK